MSLDIETMAWAPGSPFYGPGSIWQGRELVPLKVLSDRTVRSGTPLGEIGRGWSGLRVTIDR